MFGMKRYCLTDDVTRVVNGEDLTFSGYTKSDTPFSITVKFSDANRWVNGDMIQNCFPYLDSEQREILMTGYDDICWKEMFGDSEE